MKPYSGRLSLARIARGPGCLAPLIVAALLSNAPASAQPIVIKFSHVVAADAPKGRAAVYFKKLAEERTRGRVQVEIYPDGKLYKDSDEVAALQKGQVQMLAPSLAKFAALGVPEFELFDLPYVFNNYAALHRVTMGTIGRDLLNKLQPQGIVGLAYWDNGFKQMSANKPLRKPEDFQGLKFRIQSSKVLEAQFRALGAVPQVMAFSEVYQALQTGVVDGQENTPSNIYTQKMHEVQKYISHTDHGYIGYVVVVNKAFWEGLPADIRGQLERAMADATTYGNDISQKENAEAFEAIKKSGKSEILELTAAEQTALRNAMEPVYKEMAARLGQPIIDEFLKETGAATH